MVPPMLVVGCQHLGTITTFVVRVDILGLLMEKLRPTSTWLRSPLLPAALIHRNCTEVGWSPPSPPYYSACELEAVGSSNNTEAKASGCLRVYQGPHACCSVDPELGCMIAQT